MSDNQSINLGDDNFVRSVINRQVGKLIAKSDFTQQDRSDLVQEVYVRATKSLRLYDPSVGHLERPVLLGHQPHFGVASELFAVVVVRTRGKVCFHHDPNRLLGVETQLILSSHTMVDSLELVH